GSQVQGVWVHPDHRGEGLAAPAMAAVVNQILTDIAPAVTLYVNDHTIAARRTYERVGFTQTATFASILLSRPPAERAATESAPGAGRIRTADRRPLERYVVTRMSRLFVRTLRDDPADAGVPSHRLLVRAGYVRRAAPGIYSWLPLGYAVLRNVERIVRAEMDAIGAQEVHFPALLPKEPYAAAR